MVKVALANPRAQVSSTPEGLLIRMRGQRKSYAGFIAVFWLFFLFIFSMSVFQDASRPGARPPDYLAMFFPLIIMALFFVPLVWLFMSTEQVRVNSRELVLGRMLFGLGRTREFDLANVKDLRPVAQPFAAWGSMGRYGSLYGQAGSMAFDYGSRTYRFGAGLDEAEAKYLVREIVTRYPALAEKGKTT